MIAPKYAWTVVALLALALVPTLVHTYGSLTIDDGRRAESLSPRLAGYESVPTGRSAEWVRRRFDTDDFLERRYGPVRLFVARSLDLKSLYHHPELAVAYRLGFEPESVRRVDAAPDVPLHVLRRPGDGGGLALYALLYGQRTFVERPIAFHLRLAGELLVRPREPMTLFFAVDETASPGAPLEGAPAAAVLAAAIADFASQPALTLVGPRPGPRP